MGDFRLTGREAITYLHAGYTLRRKEWEPNQKCRAYFSDAMWSIRIDINDPILFALDTHLVPQWVPDKPEFANYVCFNDVLDSGDLLEDDWEIVE
jgi:hypothetical protein